MELSLSTRCDALDNDMRMEPYSVKERPPWKGKMFVKDVLNRSTPLLLNRALAVVNRAGDFLALKEPPAFG